MLSSLDGILLGREAERIVAHRVKDIESAQTLVAAVDIARDVAERVSHMKSRT